MQVKTKEKKKKIKSNNLSQNLKLKPLKIANEDIYFRKAAKCKLLQ